MTETELILNPDHRAWAAEFCKKVRERGFDPANPDHEDWLGAWFANAMMNGYDRANRTESDR
jgi:hypothetical protein